jgi:hypothetical protein
MDELGWDTLKACRAMQRSVLMFKIQHHLAPPYLVEACPPLVGESSSYNLRNADNISLPMGRRTGYFNSFMPGAIRLWNGLNRDIKATDSLDSFKYKLKQSKCAKKVKLYSKFNGAKAINHSHIRMGLSGLKAQRHDYRHVDSPKCDYCGGKKEDAMHYLLQCNAFATMRTVLLNNVMNLYLTKNIAFDLRRTIVQKELVSYLLCGDARLNEWENADLFRMVQQFISSSKRF